MSPLRRHLATVLCAVVTAMSCLAAGPAQAESGYRYWGYFHSEAGSNAWKFADKGPDDTTPADGSVEGWRFAITVGTSGREPRAAADFDAICGDAAADEGEKRVAVVIDYGVAAEAPDGETPPEPRGECAVVSAQASGTQVLQSVADVRVDAGLTCGIDGYPAGECGPEIKDASVPAKDEPVTLQLASADAAAEFPWAPVGVGIVVLALAAAAWLIVRRRA